MPTILTATGEHLGSSMGDWWSALEPSAMIVERVIVEQQRLPVLLPGRSCAPRQAAFS
jgi:hypothetical protein